MADKDPWAEFRVADPWADFRVKEETRSTAGDIAHSLASGAVKGAAGLPGIGGDLETLGRLGHDWLRPNSEKWAGHTYLPTTEDVLGAADKLLPGTKEFADYEPQTTAGKFANAAGSFLPGAVAPGAITGAIARRGAGYIAGQAARDAVRYGAVPGLLSEGAGQAAEAYAPDNKLLATGARVAGGLLGPLAGRAVTGPQTVAKSIAQDTNDVRNSDVAYLRSQGVDPNPGQASGKKYVTHLYDELNPERYTETRDAFTRAAMRRAGPEYDALATPGDQGTIANMRRDAGQRFEDAIATAAPMQQDAQFANDVGARMRHVNKPGLYTDEHRAALNGARQQINDLFASNHGTIPPGEYQTLRSELREQARSLTDDRAARQLNGLVDDLDSLMERNITQTGGDAGRFRDARDFYKRYLTLKDATNPDNAHIMPAALARAAERVYGDTSALEHGNPFSQLAQAGKNVLGEAKSSGTSERAYIQRILSAAGAIPAMGLDYLLGNHEHLATTLALEPIIGAGGAAAAKPVVRGLLDNPIGRRAVSNMAQGDSSHPLLSVVPGLLQQEKKREPLRITVHPNGQ